MLNSSDNNKHVILIGIDGIRSDALKIGIQKGELPNFERIINNGYANFSVQSLRTTLSVPCWKSILTGRISHGITQNNYLKHCLTDKGVKKKNTDIKHIQQIIFEHDPSIITRTITSWNKLHIEHLLENEHNTNKPLSNFYNHMSTNVHRNDDPDLTASKHDLSNMGLPNKKYIEGLDKKVFEETLNALDTKDTNSPQFIFTYFDYVDSAGHYGNGGFSIDNPKYKQALKHTDSYIKQIYNAIEQRCIQYESEKWLVVLITDHGGTVPKDVGLSDNSQVCHLGHGQDTYHERASFIILKEFYNVKKLNETSFPTLNYDKLSDSEDKTITPSIADTPLIIYDYLNIPAPDNLDSKRFIDLRSAYNNSQNQKSIKKKAKFSTSIKSLYDIALDKYREKTEKNHNTLDSRL